VFKICTLKVIYLFLVYYICILYIGTYLISGMLENFLKKY